MVLLDDFVKQDWENGRFSDEKDFGFDLAIHHTSQCKSMRVRLQIV